MVSSTRKSWVTRVGIGVVALSVFPATAQRVITTVAGTDWFLNAEGQKATATPLSKNIYNAATDSQGNFYVADPLNNVVLKIGADGITHVVAGNGIASYSGDGGAAINASLWGPQAAVLDRSGNLFIADTNNNVIRRVTPDGTISTYAGNGIDDYTGDGGPALFASFGSVFCLAVDSSNNLLFCDSENSVVRKISSNGLISTVAGNGKAAYTGDGGRATAASMDSPQAVALDAAGQIYIADFNNDVIRRVALDGTISTYAGTGDDGFSGDGGPPKAARFSGPAGLAFDAAGNLYISDANNYVVRMVSTSGLISTVAGNGDYRYNGDGGLPLQTALFFPSGLAVDASGRVLVVDQANGRVRAFTPGVSINTLAGNGLYRFIPERTPALKAYLFDPRGVAIDRLGQIYISDTANSAVRKITLDGLIQTIAGFPGVQCFGGDEKPATSTCLNYPRGLALAPNGDLYVADQDNNQIHRIGSDGVSHLVAGSPTASPGYSGDNGLATQALLDSPSTIAFDPAGNLYVADENNNVIRKISSSGIITTFAGTGAYASTGDGGLATAATINTPSGIAADAAGNVYIAEYYGHKIRKVTPAGIISTYAGTGKNVGPTGDGGQAVNANLDRVFMMIFDPQGNLYFSEVYSGPDRARVRVITPGGVISTIAGSGPAGFSGDGGPATQATMYIPSALAVGPDGSLYIADAGNNRLRAVIPKMPSFFASPAQLTFSVTSGGGVSLQQNVALAATLQGAAFEGLPFAVNATTASGGAWLRTTPASGAMPGSVGVSVDPGNLSPGTYQGAVQFAAPGASPGTVSLPVAVNVGAAIPPSLGVDSSQITFSTPAGGSPSSGVLALANTGGGTLNVTAAASTSSGGNWLSVSPGQGAVTPGAPLQVSLQADPTGLSPGTYSGQVLVASDQQQQVAVPVTLSVSAPQAVILLSQTGLTFTTVAQGGAPLPQTVGILNTGTGSLSWTATASTLSGGSNWLSISPGSGTVATPFLDFSPVTVAVNAAGLAPGDYYGRVDIASAGAVNAPQTITIVMNVLPPGANPGPQVRPTGLIFTSSIGAGNPGSKTVSVSNITGSPLQYGSSLTYVGAGNWLQNLPATASVNPNNPVQVVVQPNFSTLAPGVTRAYVSLGFSDGNQQAVSVLAVLAPNGAGGSSAGRKGAGGCSPSTLNIIPTSTGQAFTASLNQPATLEAQIVDDCGIALTPDRGGISVKASFSNADPAVSLVHTSQGRWAGTWQPRNPASGTARATITALLALPTGKLLANQIDLSVTLASGASVPIVNPGQVLNAASFVAQAPVAPGSLISIFGSNLADGTAQSDAPLPSNLSGTTVVLGGHSVPLVYASNGQLSALVPYDVPVNTQLQLLVQRGSALSVGNALTVAAAQPAIFTTNQQGTGQGDIIDATTGVVADANGPASAGDTLVIYCTGLGAVDPPVPNGSPSPDSPASQTINAVAATIGGVPAQVQFSGLVPGGTPGLYQVIAVMPDGVTPGSQVPVQLTVAGQTSPPVTMATQ